MSRRKSWKAVEPYESYPSLEGVKPELTDATNEDAYIDTYSELLANSAPSWSSSSPRRPTYVEQDYSSDESVLSEAMTFNDYRANEIADRLQSFKGKKAENVGNSESQSSATVTTSSSTNGQYSDVDSSYSSTSRTKGKNLSRSMSFDARNKTNARDGPQKDDLRRSWAEKKHPSPESSKAALSLVESSSLPKYTPDNPPPPPPRRNRRISHHHLFPPPPPPPPAPLKHNLKARRLSSGESISRRLLHKSLTESSIPDRRRRRVSFQDDPPNVKQFSNSFSGTSLSGLKKMERRSKRASITSTSVVVPTNGFHSKDERSYRRPKQLSNSFPGKTFSGPKRSNSIQESLSSSMPNILSSSRLAVEHEDADANDQEWSDILSAVEDKNTNDNRDAGADGPCPSKLNNLPEDHNVAITTTYSSHPTRQASFNENSRRSNRRQVREVFFDGSSPLDADDFHTVDRPTRQASFNENNRRSHRRDVSDVVFDGSSPPDVDHIHQGDNVAMAETPSPTPSKKQDEPQTVVAEESEVSSDIKDISTKNKILNMCARPIQKVRSNRSGSIDEDPSSSRPKYDKNGRCKKHPSIIIAKKRPFAKGWDLIRECTQCAEFELSASKTNHLHGQGKMPDEPKRRKSRGAVGVDELLAPSDKKYDWRQLSSSFTSTKSSESEVKRIEGADAFLATSNALRSATSLSEAASKAISQGMMMDSPSERRDNFGETVQMSKQLDGSSRQLDNSARSGSSLQLSRQLDSRQLRSMDYGARSGSSMQLSRQSDSRQHGSSRQLNSSDRQLDYSIRSECNGNTSRQLDYSTRSEQLDFGTRSEVNRGNARSSAVVSKMPYKTKWGEFGWYSGEVDNNGIPNGMGRMRFKSGQQHSGIWTDGLSEQYMEVNGRMKRGFGSNVAAWKENSFSDSYSGFSSRIPM